MIYSIQGKLTQKHPTLAIVDVGGVGYGVNISLATYERLGEIGSSIFLSTYLHVREDALTLFGFYSELEREMFLALLTVSGIGPKIAIGILSRVSIDEFCDWIRQGSTEKIKRVPGVGPKTAERLVLELKNKVDKIASLKSSTPSVAVKGYEEAMLALQSLGYKSIEAKTVLDAVAKEIPASSPTEDFIKFALKKLM